MKVAELKEELAERGLDTTGLKAVLAERLLEAITSVSADGAPTPADDSSLKKQWLDTIAAGGTAIRVAVGPNVFGLKDIQLVELQKWARGDKYDKAWLKVDSAGAPTHFVAHDGSKVKLSIEIAAQPAPPVPVVAPPAPVVAPGAGEAVVIGSFALAHWAPGALPRAPADVDLVATSAFASALLAALKGAGLLLSHAYSHGDTKLHVRLAPRGSLPLDVELVRPGEASSSAQLLAASAAWPEVAFPVGVPALAAGAGTGAGASAGAGAGLAALVGLCRARVAPLAALLAAKQSHLIFPVHWHKTMEDYHVLKALVHNAAQAHGGGGGGDGGDDPWGPFVKVRRAEAAARYAYKDGGDSKVGSLDIPNEKFFKVWYLKELVPEAVRRAALVEGREVFTHDELHELLAYAPGKPLYKTYKRDPTKVRPRECAHVKGADMLRKKKGKVAAADALGDKKSLSRAVVP